MLHHGERQATVGVTPTGALFTLTLSMRHSGLP